ncbi:MAG TPA: ABC transporter ATP-binding protein [Burkholderiales bacterium]|nr:ABC transporter ATP-binding protein [Burkholderiales bacterium]
MKFDADVHPEIAVDGVGKSFGAVTAVEDISFEIPRGRFVSLLGPSGCGKSTILRMLAGLIAPSRGAVSFKGGPVLRPPAGMVYVFQQYTKSLFPWLTVLGNVEFGATSPHAAWRAKGARRDECMDTLRLVGLDKHAESYPWQLSGGMQQRVAIARAVVARPQVLLMDEPFSALDALTRESLQDLLLKLWQELRLTVVFVTHDIAESIYLSDEIVVLSHAPSRILARVAVDVGRPRDQLTTRELPQFLAHRRSLYELVVGRQALQ